MTSPGALALAAAAALARPWFVVLPPALLVAYELGRSDARSFLRWPRSSSSRGLAAFGYLVLAGSSSGVGAASLRRGRSWWPRPPASPSRRSGWASSRWLVAVGDEARPRPEAALLSRACRAWCSRRESSARRRAVREWRSDRARARPARVRDRGGCLVARSTERRCRRSGGGARARRLAVPGLDRSPSDRAAGMSVFARTEDRRSCSSSARSLRSEPRSRCCTTCAAARGRGGGRGRVAARHILAWSSVHADAKGLAAAVPSPRDWVDQKAARTPACSS